MIDFAQRQCTVRGLLAELAELDAEITLLRERKRRSDEQVAALRAELVQLQVEEATLQRELAEVPPWAAPTGDAQADTTGASHAGAQAPIA